MKNVISARKMGHSSCKENIDNNKEPPLDKKNINVKSLDEINLSKFQ